MGRVDATDREFETLDKNDTNDAFQITENNQESLSHGLSLKDI